jgi:hypothetical protein
MLANDISQYLNGMKVYEKVINKNENKFKILEQLLKMNLFANK